MAEDSLQRPFTYWLVAHDVQHMVAPQLQILSKDPRYSEYHMQVVRKGMDTYSTAGVACGWLGSRLQKIFKLRIVAHGGPGSFMLGVNVTSDNAAPLGGWFRSFFDGSKDNRIEILGCACAADSVQIINQFQTGQINTGTRPGYRLLRELAEASRQPVAGAMYPQTVDPLGLKMRCRLVRPGGGESFFPGEGANAAMDPF